MDSWDTLRDLADAAMRRELTGKSVDMIILDDLRSPEVPKRAPEYAAPAWDKRIAGVSLATLEPTQLYNAPDAP